MLLLTFTSDQLLRLLFVFWLPAHLAHLIAFMIANHDDIFISWKIFFLGDISSWGLVCGMTALVIYTGMPVLFLWIYIGIHIVLISTVFTDAALFQETISVGNIKKIFVETLLESILIPWIAGIAVGVLSTLIFGL